MIRVGNVSFSSSDSQEGYQVTCMSYSSKNSVSFLFLCIIEVSTAKASPVVILFIKGGYICFRAKAKIIEANFPACALNGGLQGEFS